MKKFTAILLTIVLFFPSLAFADSLVTVSATVNPHASDFQLAIDSSPGSGTTVNQDQTIIYTITYGSHLSYTTPLRIVGSWNQGTISGQSSPSVDIADYVINSATKAYNNSPPVVDTTNKTITWTIPSFPANKTDQTISFSLQTNASYTGMQTVTFPTTAQLSVNGVTIPAQSTTTTYQYNPVVTVTPTPVQMQPTIAPTSRPSTSGNVLLSPTPIISTGSTPPTFQTATITSLASTHAVIAVTTNEQTTLSLAYGMTLSNLTKTTSDQSLGTDHIITLSELQPDTQYYYRLTAITRDGRSATSDIFTFTTPVVSNLPQIDKSSVIVTSEKTLLFDLLENQSGQLKNTVIIPTDTAYEFTFSLTNDLAKQVTVYLKNKQVLGINTFGDMDLPTDNAAIFESQPGVYQGRLKSPATLGIYQLLARILDTNGNITELPLLDIQVVKHFTLYDKNSLKAIEHAQIQLFRQDEQSKSFIAITPQMLAIPAPLLSDANGQVPIVLPQGTYNADITADGYKDSTVTFTLNPSNKNGYPTVYMERSFFSFGAVANTVKNTVTYCIGATRSYFGDIFQLHQVFQLISFLVISITVTLSVFSLSIRLGISPFLFPWYMLSGLQRIMHKDQQTIADNNTSLSPAIATPKEQQLVRKDTRINMAEHIVIRLCKHFLSFSFELLLLLSIVGELLCGWYLGWMIVIPFLLISLFNLLLWIIDNNNNLIA